MAEAAVELRAILDSAERAASAEDFASAEHYLRQAAVIQEGQLGPLHPELANTLNNLGIVFERIGKPADAEASYRRAYAIATATLAADDPLVMTSGQNLRDFCAATGKPFELAPPPPATPSPAPGAVPMSATPRTTPVATSPAPGAVPISAAPRATPLAATSAPPTVPVAPLPSPGAKPATPDTRAAVTVARSSVRAESAAATSRRYLTALAITSLIAIVATIAWLAAPASTNVTPAAPPAAAPAPPAEVAPSRQANADTARDRVAAPRADTTPAVAETPPVAVAEKARPASRAAVSLVETKLCRSLSLSDWQCTPLTSPAPPGRVFYYTRVKAGSDTTVQHRWYINGSLLQNVELRIGANTGAGFRTYSRNTVATERRGTWTIELRDADGALLHEERFVVQ